MSAIAGAVPVTESGLLDVGGDPAFRILLEDLAEDAATLNARVSRDDEMFLDAMHLNDGNLRRSLLDYFTNGRRIIDVIRSIVRWYFGEFAAMDRYLEFAAGYGRSIRYLVQHLPPERVWVCDIYEDAMQFQRRWHGVHAVESVPSPDQFPPPGLPGEGSFDFVFACSFFSHMPESSFVPWLEKLHQLVSPGGALAFSVLDLSLSTPDPVQSPGIRFCRTSESRTLDRNQYGVTYVTEKFVRRACRAALPPRVAVHRIPRGLNNHQDVYIIANDPARDPAGLVLGHHPIGFMDACERRDGGRLLLKGWAADPNEGGGIESVRVAVNGRTIRHIRPHLGRGDVAALHGDFALQSGWECPLGASEARPRDVVMVKAVNDMGLERVLFCDHLRAIDRRRPMRKRIRAFFGDRPMRKRDVVRHIPPFARVVRYVETLEGTLLQRTKQVEDLEETLSQVVFSDVASLVEEGLEAEDGLPIPGSGLRFLVTAQIDPNEYLRGGRQRAQLVADLLARRGRNMGQVGKVLDLGCGCGRVIRHLRDSGAEELHGCDRNGKAIAWCRQFLPFGAFEVNDAEPPLPYPDGMFGLIYAYPHPTQPAEPMPVRWIEEIRRVLAQGGYFVLSVNGRRPIEGRGPAEGLAGSSPSAVFHPDRCVREAVARGFEVIEMVEVEAQAAGSHRDYLLKRTA